LVELFSKKAQLGVETPVISGSVLVESSYCELKQLWSVRTMSYLRRSGNRKAIAIIGLAIGASVAISSCGKSDSANRVSSEAPASSPAASTMADAKSKSVGREETTSTVAREVPQRPQLIKRAELSLRLESIDKMMVQLRQIVQSKQGDIYDFQDDRSLDNDRHRQATLVLKVPGQVLDATVAEIAKLGRVESQGVKSEDVTQQIVDTDARLKNLRQQEDLTRKIMERSGSVRDILAVSKELSAIREQIEQLDASVKNLRQQVAYSTINLKVEEMQSTTPSSDAFGVQVQETWKNSTHAAGSLGTNLVLGLLWLLPFIPFMAIGAGGVYYVIGKRRQQLPVVETPTSEEG
jgi:archaellum component FlaC